MKKIFLFSILVLFAGISTAVLAEEILLEPVEESMEAVKPIITAPKWEEFCEPGYENAVVKTKNDVFNYVTFVKSERDKSNYWASRRESFEKYLNHCKTIVDDTDRGVCYTDLRRLETDKNEVFNSKRQEIIFQNNMIIKDATK